MNEERNKKCSQKSNPESKGSFQLTGERNFAFDWWYLIELCDWLETPVPGFGPIPTAMLFNFS